MIQNKDSNKKKVKRDNLTTHDSIAEERKFLIWGNDDFFLREAYKTARTNVMFSLAGKEGCNVIAVTSSLQSEGKSITASNLAMSFADNGSRVLIIDCDLRKPKMGRLLDIKAERGLTDVLINKSELSGSVIRVNEKKGLWALTSGRIPPNPSELLGSESMVMLMNSLKGNYDYIILDTPPVEMVTDAMVLAPIVDGVLFVVRANSRDRRAFAHSIEQLEYANAKILGVIFNGTEQGGGGYGYKRYGYSRYGYRRYGYSRYGYGKYGYGRYGYGKYGYGGYGYGYGNQSDSAEKAQSDKKDK